MKIISWNLCCTNKRYPEIISHIKKNNVDIACLQEVTEDALFMLKKLKGYDLYPIVVAEGKNKRKNIYLVILSKHKIKNSKSFVIDEKEPRTLWAFAVKSAYGLKKVYHKGHFVDLMGIRIFNLHLPSTVSPVKRLNGLKKALKQIDESKINIICGDFNTYGIWYFNFFFIIFMKHSIKDLLFNEIKEFKKTFNEYNLNDIFSGKYTVSLLNFKYHGDYILAPNDTEVLYNKTQNNTFGSDHKMILAKLKV